ncbi:MAG: hypothetical protein HC902_06930 [Calothrix sp. SM1_5_4]|nr:hypothetical protein [Calothrix sp. SM1_5_4]
MIRVNLLKSRVGDTQTSTVQEGASGQGEMRENLTKVFFIAIFTVALMFYESQNLETLGGEQRRIQVQIQELEAQLDVKNKEIESVKDVEAQAAELEDKLKVLKMLSRLRLREVKTLDFMQSSIPEKVWLKSVSFQADRDKPDQGLFDFRGVSVVTEDLTEFTKKLEDSAYLYEVIVLKNQDVPATGRVGSLREFHFTAQVETKN